MKISDLIRDLEHYRKIFGEINVICPGEHGTGADHFTNPQVTTCMVVDSDEWNSGYTPLHPDDAEEYRDDTSLQRVIVIEGA